VIFLAGLQGIPQEYYEAAAIDGANAWTKFRRITLPLLSPVTFFVLVTGIIGTFQDFALVWVLTGGGPANATQLKQYKWVETTVISMKGEEKSRIQKQCFYGPDGKVQKQQLTAPPAEEPAPGGLKGKIAAKKKGEITATMQQAVALVQSYVPPDPQRMQAPRRRPSRDEPDGPDSAPDLRNYVKRGDNLSRPGHRTKRPDRGGSPPIRERRGHPDDLARSATAPYPQHRANVPGRDPGGGPEPTSGCPGGAEAGGWGR
jgi:hypothetical protein